MFNQAADPIAASLVQSGVMRRVVPGEASDSIFKDELAPYLMISALLMGLVWLQSTAALGWMVH